MSDFRIKHNKNIGTVILVVEGSKDEPKFLKTVLSKILHYEVIEKVRNRSTIREFTEYVSKQNRKNRFIIVNTGQPNIKSIMDHVSFRNDIAKELMSKIGSDYKNARIYYLWDKDMLSNDDNVVRTLLYALQSPYDNGGIKANAGYEKGLLLLSYPAFEAYKLSCIEDCSDKSSASLRHLKSTVKIRLLRMTKEKICKAAKIMDKTIEKLNFRFDIDKIGEINIKVYNAQKKLYDRHNYYRILSMLSVVFIDLGILEE